MSTINQPLYRTTATKLTTGTTSAHIKTKNGAGFVYVESVNAPTIADRKNAILMNEIAVGKGYVIWAWSASAEPTIVGVSTPSGSEV